MPAMTLLLETKQPRPSTTGWIVQSVRDAIFAGQLKPGDRIVEAKLAKDLGVGISPVREALQQLEYLALVTRYSNRGTYITELSLQDVRQIYRLRTELESLSVQYAMESGKREGVAKLQDCANRMMIASVAGRVSEFIDCDLEFHRLICQMAADPYLEKCLVSVTSPLFAFVLIRLKQSPILFDFIELSKRHQEIVDVFTMNDLEGARSTVRRLIGGFAEILIEKLYGSSEGGK